MHMADTLQFVLNHELRTSISTLKKKQIKSSQEKLQVSFNEEVETFVLPSKRSLKGKKRRKNKNGSSSASESSDEASSPSPTR